MESSFRSWSARWAAMPSSLRSKESSLLSCPATLWAALGEQLIDGYDIGAVDPAHAIPRTILARPLVCTHFSRRQRKRLSPSRRATNGNIVPFEREKLRCFQV